MDLSFGRSELNPERGASKEWLLTNGLGGFASSTIIGLNRRRYHGLLIAALNPPVDRRLLVAKLDEDFYIDGERFVLSTNQVRNGYAQQGYRYLLRFRRYPFPEYTYQIKDVFLVKTIFMLYGENTTVVHYLIINGYGRDLKIFIFPLVNCRDYHGTTYENSLPFQQNKLDDRQVRIDPFPGAPPIYLGSDRAEFNVEPSWYRGMYYFVEDIRGLPAYEDHFIPGYFCWDVQDSGEFTLVLSTKAVPEIDYQGWRDRQQRRQEELLRLAGYRDFFARTLCLAADDFIVWRKSTGKKTVIAGYPWFSDWGRDAMIALPGLALCTKRFQDAREILATFAAYVKDGLLPNMFPDAGEEPIYNTVDASLWYFYAVQKYLAYTGDYRFVREELFPVLRSIIDNYRRGTRFQIAMDGDGLIAAGSPGIQLTWMDARVGDWVVTPRHGKPVEVNALWYNALMLMSELSKLWGLRDEYGSLAVQVRRSFLAAFWNEEKQCLYDVVGEEPDPSVRPNQIIAVSLPHSVLPKDKAKAVVRKVFEELYIGTGLRSLSSLEPGFQGRYQGDQYSRDAAYHQGTAWSWLLGHFITAYRKVFDYSQESLVVARLLLAPLKDHLCEQGLGTISEIFDASYPFTPRGCFAQAWGVAEALRCFVEDLKGE
ncbi:MAG: Glycogen debranching enzyme [Thermacetogenium phaeum]|uniref:Glycogen debranching enzyme n=1 Tax=Thermacetogenium phaeum TaxID=85874 RepID=A0A101FEY4_9THEO|nr:MAG: Glycogen debranching enzyme [Thermacetogenium phaeum]